MKASALRELSPEALTEELVRLRREQFDLRMQAATGQGARPHQQSSVRRDIARVKTIIREQQQAEQAT